MPVYGHMVFGSTIFCSIWMKIHIRVQETNSYKYNIYNMGSGHVTVILHNSAKNGPNMGVPAVGGWGLVPPQKFCHWF